MQIGEAKRIICPRRFYENNYNILREIKEFIWSNGAEIDCYDEFRISIKTPDGDAFQYGNLDWILINKADTSDFCGVEIQTDSTTGTGAFKDCIGDLIKGRQIKSYSRIGLNTLASFKGFLPQFIFKGQLFDDWKRPYCAIMQDELWEKFIKKFRIRFREIYSYSTETFLFFVYSLEYSEKDKRYHIGRHKIYASRWIDILFSFSVKSNLLLNLPDIHKRIMRKIKLNSPIVSF